MSKIRVLFLPPFFGFPSHFIPLVKLYQQLAADDYEAGFLLPRSAPEDIAALRKSGLDESLCYYYSREFLASFNVPVIGVRQQFSVVSELAAYKEFAPDVLIDDSNPITALARQAARIPRLTIARNGIFSHADTPSRYRHSLDTIMATLREPGRSIFSLPGSLDGYFEAEAHVIPATRSIESLAGLPTAGTSAYHCGPLLLDAEEERRFYSDELQQFFEANRGRRVVYVTFGVDASRNPHSRVWDCVRELERRDFAVITNLKIEAQAGCCARRQRRDRYVCVDALPMHYVCSRVSLVVHVCGSATYHYPILHGCAAITVGTQCRDRETTARTLCARGLSQHVPAPDESDEFSELFTQALDRYEAGRFPFDEALAQRMSSAREDMARTAAQFRIEAAIHAALERAPAGVQGIR